jgi:isopenicillin-N N-acyltransferase-like protein
MRACHKPLIFQSIDRIVKGVQMRKIIATIIFSMLLSKAFFMELDSPITANLNHTSNSNPNSNVIARHDKAYLENISGVLLLHVKGSPYEMGYQNGFLLKDRIQASIQYHNQTMIDLGYSYEYMVNCSKAMEPHIPQEYIEEMQGLADGASVDYTDVFLLQIDADLPGRGWTGCSGFAVFGNATTDGHLYHGRSLDSPLLPKPSCLVTVYEPERGDAFTNIGHFGIIGADIGMSKKGISLGLKFSSSSDKTLDGMPILFILRKVLQYSNNLKEAINIINQTGRTTGWNIVLGNGKNLNACALEISDNYCKVFWAGDPTEDILPHYSIENVVRRTNHYVDPELAATQRFPYDPRDTWDWSWNRYEKLSQLILGNYSNIDADMSIQFLRTPPVAGWYPNRQSVVFDSTDLELWVATANSTTSAYLRQFIYLSRQDLFPGSNYVPVNKLESLAQYIGLTILLAIGVVTAVYIKKRREKQRLSQTNNQRSS